MNKEVKIIKERCPNNHKCRAVSTCPASALSQNKNETPNIDYDKCIKCGKCLNICPKKVFVLEKTN